MFFELDYTERHFIFYFAGDVVTPGIFEDYITAWSTIMMPHDCAEGYLYEIGINLLVLKYLQILQALDVDTLDRVKGFLNTGEHVRNLIIRTRAYV